MTCVLQHDKKMTVKIEVDEKYRPGWYNKSYPAHLPLPKEEAQPLEGDVLLWGRSHDQRIPLLSVKGQQLFLKYDEDLWRTYILYERYRTLKRPLYTKLPFHYHRIPDGLRNLIAGKMFAGRVSENCLNHDFPGFPIEQGYELFDHVIRSVRGVENAQPQSETILTHDIDTAEGFLWVKKIAELEKKYGYQSLWTVVGKKYDIDYAVLDWLVENGFEVGLHGYNHDNKLIFLSEAEIRNRIESCRELINRYGMKSFRSPSWFRSEKLFHVLSDYFEYDYSCLDTDIICPGGYGGCLTTKSFKLNGLRHIVTTIPYEVPLFFNVKQGSLLDYWMPKINWLREVGGNIVVNTHPDPHYSGNDKMLGEYEALLKVLKN